MSSRSEVPCLLLPDKEFLFELSGQALSPVCRKTYGRDPRPRPASSLDLFHPSSAARSVRTRACTAESAVPNRFRFDSENLSGAARPRGHPARLRLFPSDFRSLSGPISTRIVMGLSPMALSPPTGNFCRSLRWTLRP